MSDDEFDRRFKAYIVGRLTALGLNADRVSVEYQDYLQDYEIVVGGDALTRDQIVAITAAVGGRGIISFVNEADRGLDYEIRREITDASLRRRASEILSLPRSNPATTSLAEFAREIEIYCGVVPGSVLEVWDAQTLTFKRIANWKAIDWETRVRLSEIASLALVDSGVRLVILGGTG